MAARHLLDIIRDEAHFAEIRKMLVVQQESKFPSKRAVVNNSTSEELYFLKHNNIHIFTT